jgi:hypothetical protein
MTVASMSHLSVRRSPQHQPIMNVIGKSQNFFLNDGNRKALLGRPQQDPALLTLLTVTEKTNTTQR